MYARVVTGHIRADRIDEAIRFLRESVYPLTRDQKGYDVAQLFLERSTNRLLSISLWDTEASMQASDSYLPEATVREFPWASPPTREGYEVVAQA